MKRILLLSVFFLTGAFMFAQNASLFQAKAVDHSNDQVYGKSSKTIIDSLHYDGVNASAIGTGQQDEFGVYSYWPEESIANYDGLDITEIKLYISGVSDVASIQLEIRHEQSSEPVFVQEFDAVEGWNNVILETPYTINGSQEFYFGYYMNISGGYPAGCDGGPIAANGNGNWILYGGEWAHLNDLNPSLTGNWNIRGMLDATFELDAGVSDVLPGGYVLEGEQIISGSISNSGNSTINTIDINYQINEGEVFTESLTDLNLANGESISFEHANTWNASAGNYSLNVWVSNINGGDDDFSANNSIETDVIVAIGSTTRYPLYEEFTSSTCGPCANFNSSAFTIDYLESNADVCNVIKYQMNWPSPGDDYYTAEGGVRRDYYGVSGVPALYIDGASSGDYSTAALQATLDAQAAKPAYFELSATHTIQSGNEIVDIEVDITPYITASDFTLHAVVVEHETTGNVGNNGETEFHYVMMKMAPNALGTSVDFVAGETQTISLSSSLEGTNIEQYTDLQVVVFLQDDATQEVHQSAESVAQGNNLTFNVASNGTSISGAEVSVDGLGLVETNNAGVAVFTGLEDATGVAYEVSKDGYETATGSTDISGETAVDVELVPMTYTLTFEVSYAGEPVSDATITFETLDDVLTTDAEGVASIGLYPTNNLAYTIAHDDYETYTGTVSFAADKTVEIEMTVGISDNNINELRVYPNPATDVVNVSVNQAGTIEIYNAAGALMKKSAVNAGEQQINVEDLQKGMYYISVRTLSGRSIQKIVIE